MAFPLGHSNNHASGAQRCMNIRYYCSAKMRAADRGQCGQAAGAARQVPTSIIRYLGRAFYAAVAAAIAHTINTTRQLAARYSKGVMAPVPVGTRPGNRACLSIFAQQVFGRVPARLLSAFVLIKSPHVEDWGTLKAGGSLVLARPSRL